MHSWNYVHSLNHGSYNHRLEKLMRLADILLGSGRWRKNRLSRLSRFFLSAAAASRSKKSAAAADGGGLGVYSCWSKNHIRVQDQSINQSINPFAAAWGDKAAMRPIAKVLWTLVITLYGPAVPVCTRPGTKVRYFVTGIDLCCTCRRPEVLA